MPVCWFRWRDVIIETSSQDAMQVVGLNPGQRVPGLQDCPRATAEGRSPAPSSTVNGDGPSGADVDWGLLAPRFIHSIKISIIEAMRYIDQPLSASELEKVLGGSFVSSTLSYHLKSLADRGIVEELAKEKGMAGPGKSPFILASDILE